MHKEYKAFRLHWPFKNFAAFSKISVFDEGLKHHLSKNIGLN